MLLKKTLLFSFIFLSLILALPALAVSDRDLIVTFTPKYPKPNQEITIKVTSYYFNVPTSSFVWKEDGKVKVQGIGKNEFYTQAKNLGEKTNISLLILTNENTRYQKEISIIPTNLELAVEAKTYTPYWYKGAPKITSENEVKVVATPEIIGADGKVIATDKLVYNWSLNNNRNTLQSGFGKNTFIFRPTTNNTIEVIISTLDNRFSSYGKVVIQPEKNESLLYEIKPISGIDFFNTIKDKYSPKSDDINLLIEPFYFNRQDLEGDKLSTTITLSQADKKTSQTNTGRGVKFLVDPSLDKDEIKVDIQLSNTNKTFEKSRIGFMMNIVSGAFGF